MAASWAATSRRRSGNGPFRSGIGPAGRNGSNRPAGQGREPDAYITASMPYCPNPCLSKFSRNMPCSLAAAAS